jgi:uncharacterized protein (TIGR02145 family)
MKKSALALSIFVTINVFLVGCGGNDSQNASEENNKTEANTKKNEADTLAKNQEAEEKRLKEEEEARLELEAEEKRLKEEKEAASKEVTISKQVWMTTNLNVDKFRNGDKIPQAKTAEEWKKAGESGQPAWCYFNNDKSKGTKYGKLYNWYAVTDPRGLAPAGWKIPSNSDFLTLTKFLGQDYKPKMMKTNSWPQADGANNSSGFSGVPGGVRDNQGNFLNFGKGAYFWSSTGIDGTWAYARELGANAGNWASSEFGTNKLIGMSVRCIKK